MTGADKLVKLFFLLVFAWVIIVIIPRFMPITKFLIDTTANMTGNITGMGTSNFTATESAITRTIPTAMLVIPLGFIIYAIMRMFRKPEGVQ